jgi:hypothetical protein
MDVRKSRAALVRLRTIALEAPQTFCEKDKACRPPHLAGPAGSSAKIRVSYWQK